MSDLDEILGRLEAVAQEAEVAILKYTDVDNLKTMDVVEAMSAFDRVRDVQARVKVMVGQLTKSVGKRTSSGEVVVARSGQPYEKSVGQSRKSWQHKQLKTLAAEALIAKHTDKEGRLGPVSQIIVEAFDLVSITGWKSTTMGPLGIDVKRYCTTTEGNVTLRPISVESAEEKKEEEDDGDFI